MMEISILVRRHLDIKTVPSGWCDVEYPSKTIPTIKFKSRKIHFAHNIYFSSPELWNLKTIGQLNDKWVMGNEIVSKGMLYCNCLHGCCTTANFCLIVCWEDSSAVNFLLYLPFNEDAMIWHKYKILTGILTILFQNLLISPCLCQFANIEQMYPSTGWFWINIPEMIV